MGYLSRVALLTSLLYSSIWTLIKPTHGIDIGGIKNRSVAFVAVQIVNLFIFRCVILLNRDYWCIGIVQNGGVKVCRLTWGSTFNIAMFFDWLITTILVMPMDGWFSISDRGSASANKADDLVQDRGFAVDPGRVQSRQLEVYGEVCLIWRWWWL